jgi:8-oxo-dGTP diphosphatase
MRMVINAAIIQDGELLLVRKKNTWILPGGKPEIGETDLECLCRETREELSGLELKNFRFYKEFEGVTPHKGDVLKAKVYFADINSSFSKASAEIVAAELTKKPEEYNLSDITRKVVDSLRRDHYI